MACTVFFREYNAQMLNASHNTQGTPSSRRKRNIPSPDGVLVNDTLSLANTSYGPNEMLVSGVVHRDMGYITASPSDDDGMENSHVSVEEIIQDSTSLLIPLSRITSRGKI